MRNLYLRYLTSFLSYTSRKHSFKYYSQQTLIMNLNEATVKYEEGSEKFIMSLRYIDSHINLDKQFNFERNVNESLNIFLSRIDRNIISYVRKVVQKKNRKKNKDAKSIDELINSIQNRKIEFRRNDSVLNNELTCKSILENLSDIKLVIFDAEYVLKINVPCINVIKLSAVILADYPTYPSKFNSTNTDIEESIFSWYKENKGKWIHVGDGYLYVPNTSDIGCKLKITCIPKKGAQIGPMVQIISNNPVEAGPGLCPFEIRHAFTKNKLSGKSFRVTSYNILANVYSTTELSKEVLYPYCPTYALSMNYRKLLLFKELKGYNADIICLQEVDKEVYNNDFLLILSTLNYNSVYNTKNDLQEGLAIFYNQERFDKLSCSYSIISNGTDLNGFNALWLQIQNKNVKETFLNKSTLIQIIALRSKENSEILIVCNTHLFFRPEAKHIRLLQAYYCLVYSQNFAREIKEKNQDCNVSILYCGDFNSVPETGVYQLMVNKYIPEDCTDWKSNPNECIDNISLKHDLNLSSAYSTAEYTNYTAGFCGCLDYIFYQKDYLEIEQVVPMPSKDELSLHTALPSVVFPSDHISLCVDLKWSK